MSSKSPGRKKKLIIYKVLMLDDQEVPFQLEQKTIGLDLLNLVYQYLKLIESDYFSLIYIDSKGRKCWLDYDKAVTKQITPETRLIFCIKFYTPDPGQLEEEYTRYLYALQIKKDLSDGLLLCSDATASLLASYILQAEIGDYNENFENSPNYFQNQKYFPHQNNDHELKIIDYHKNHIGQSPADADLNLLDIARKVELYGIIMHPAKDHEGVFLNLAVAHMGILVFQNYTKINTFSWAKIRKLSFKRRKFLIKLHPENFGFYKDTVEFYLDNRDDSKNFWKECIEHHSFFRCVSSRKNINKNNKSKLLTRGSSFKYYGRTQKEVIENARESFPKNRTFDRTYNSMKSINNLASESTVSNGRDMAQISGTQSLNRNLCSRNNTANSTSQSPHLIHTSRSIQPNIIKSTIIRSNDTTTTCNSVNISTTPTTPAISLVGIDTRVNDYDEDVNDDDDDDDDDLIANKVKEKKQQNNEDASTQGSRTIDSRYSRDRMLAEHDDDDDEDEENESDNDNEKDEDNVVKKPISSFAKLPKFKQHEKLKINIEQINNALKKEFELNSTPKSPPATQVTSIADKPTNEQTAQKPQSSPLKANLSIGAPSPSSGNHVNNSNNNGSNMNKIYSRKEVITIKEETKNIYNEEYTSQQLVYQPTMNYFPTVHDTQHDRLKFYNSYDKITQQQQQSIQELLQQQQTTTTTTLNSNNKRSSFSSSPIKPTDTVLSPLQNKQNKININIDNDDVDDDDDDDYVYDGVDLGNSASTTPSTSRANSRPKFSTKQFSPPPLPIISSKHATKSAIKTENYENDLPPPPPPPPQQSNVASHTVQEYKQPLILDYQDPINIHYEINSANLQYILPIDTESHIQKPQTIAKSNSYSLNQINVDDEFRRKKYSSIDGSYFIAKELLMTERTYKKDLELILIHFQHNMKSLNQFSEFLYEIINENLNPIYNFHAKFLTYLEQRLSFWIDERQKIGDLLTNINSVLKYYKNYIEKYDEMLSELELVCRTKKRFDLLYRDFEVQKICYLPFTLFLLKPIQRILHYKILFERLLIYYGQKHYDYQDIYSIVMKIEDLVIIIDDTISLIENKQKLMELQRELIGAENLVPLSMKQNRYFIREGSLQKLSRKGYQQRMFFLFNDVLLYCARSSNPVLQFKIHGEYPLKNLQVQDGNSRISIPNSFTIYSTNRSILVAAITYEDKMKWFSDICEAIEKNKSISEERLNYSTLKSNYSSDHNLDATNNGEEELEDENVNINDQIQSYNSGSSTKYSNNSVPIQQQRSNTTMHVCWHRNISVSANDNHSSVSNQLSGYLLRKFKNSNGWQKLWVVFTNFCLFFYKTYQDEYPLASLPLLGYSVTIPNETDNITKDYVFKLQFKNHVYFFRTDSQYSFDRWLDVISCAAQKL